MTAISEKQIDFTSEFDNRDFNLGIAGFTYSDLYDAQKLRALAENFYESVKDENPILGDALTKYIEMRGANYEKRVESKILTDSAPYLSEFVAKLFNISAERDELQKEIAEQNPIWKYKFFVQRRAIKKFSAEKIVELNENELTTALRELQFAAFDETIRYDEELAVAYIADKLVEAEETLTKNLEITPEVQKTLDKINTAYDKLKDKTFGKVFSNYIVEATETGAILPIKATLHLLEAWSAIEFFKKDKKWYAFKTPHGLDYQNLVHLIHPKEDLPNLLHGAAEEMRRRDGFKLTDDRGTTARRAYMKLIIA